MSPEGLRSTWKSWALGPAGRMPTPLVSVLGLTEFGEDFSSATSPSPIYMANAAEQS